MRSYDRLKTFKLLTSNIGYNKVLNYNGYDYSNLEMVKAYF